MRKNADEDNFLPSLTPYAFMQLGRVKLLPFFRPGDPAMGKAVRGLAEKRFAVMLANHGPVVASKEVEAVCNRPSKSCKPRHDLRCSHVAIIRAC